jgi:glycosyltransferase involved in cell wall biosynthesis
VLDTVLPPRGPVRVSAPPCDVRLACVNADQMYRVPVVDGVPLVAWWSWELTTFRSSFAGAAAGLAAVWTLSEHAAQALRPVLDVPVSVLPLPVLPPRAAVLPEEGRFQVLTVADLGSGAARKNPFGAVRAYCRAFGPSDGATLVVKTSGANAQPGSALRLAALTADRPDVVTLDGRLPRTELERLFERSDVLLSLHRAEGFGLPIAEAMAGGSVAVATAYGGSLEFMTDDNAVLVPYRLVPVGVGHWPYPMTAKWASPDEAFAGRALRDLWFHQGHRGRLGARAARDLATKHSVEARVPLLRTLLADVLRDNRGGIPRRVCAPRKPPSRLLAGALHRVDVATDGRWAVPLVVVDTWRARRSGREDLG